MTRTLYNAILLLVRQIGWRIIVLSPSYGGAVEMERIENAAQTAQYWMQISREELIALLQKGIPVEPDLQRADWTRPTLIAFKKAIESLGFGAIPSVEALREQKAPMMFQLNGQKITCSCTVDFAHEEGLF